MKKIKIFLSGGLGNQLFQYAEGISLGIRFKGSKIEFIYINQKNKNSPYHERPRLYELLGEEVLIWESDKKIKCLKLFEKVRISKILKYYYFQDKWWLEDKNINLDRVSNSKKIWISSLFQRAPSFEVLEIIRNKLKIGKNLVEEKEYCAIHIRLGDYLTNPTAAAEIGVLSVNYYKKVLAQLIDMNKNCYIVSDGNREQLNIIFGELLESCRIVAGNSDIDDFKILMGADYIGISNSTFSLWAAYLSNAKKVFVPNRWLSNSLNSTKDNKILYMNNWQIISE
jgi:hypothetical protein